MTDNLSGGRSVIHRYPDLIWNIGQYSSLVPAIKIGFLFLLMLLVHVFELLEILSVWGQFLFHLWNVGTDLKWIPIRRSTGERLHKPDTLYSMEAEKGTDR